MLDINFIRENAERVKADAKARKIPTDIDTLLSVDEQRRALQQQVDNTRAEANRVAKAIPQATPEEREQLKLQGSRLKLEVARMDEEITKVQQEFERLMLTVPNIMAEDTPLGEDDSQNVVIRTFREPTKFDFKPLDHLQLMEKLDLIDFERGAEVAGAKFYYLKNEAVLLDIALQHYAITKAVARGYKPLMTPDLARTSVLTGTGYQPRRGDPESEIYCIDGQDLCLIGTAEIPVGGYHMDQILDPATLPLKYVAFSHCFRTEAGASGRSSKGLYRVHQFGKVELFQFTKPEDSAQALEDIVALEEEIFQGLGIPYHVVRICSGDMGAPAYQKYDLEAWMPGKGENGEYGEVTSCSNCTDYQARRLNIRYKQDGKTTFVHTLNGTAVALSRAPVALIENYQNADGSITIPEVLRPYFNGQTKIGPR